METYFASDTIQFFDVVEKIKIENIKSISIMITKDVLHCHLLRFISNTQINIIGSNKQKYTIYLDPTEISSNPKWQFNSTLFFYSNNRNLSFSNLYFSYVIEKYDFISLTLNSEGYSVSEVINLKNYKVLNSFSIVLMEFYNSQLFFIDCTFENNTNRAFEIILQKKSLITFKDCVFKGDFKFTLDIDSKITIH